MDNNVKKLKEIIDNSNNIVFFGGAGVSTASGLRDFKGENGLYKDKYDKPTEYYLSAGCFYREPEVFYKFYKENMNTLNVKPNIIHYYLTELEKLGKLKAYSLLLVFFDRLYDNNRELLRSILELLCNFMIRYRVVSSSNGSGDIRKTLFTLLSKITKNDIELNYDNILYELSNSPSPGGRFPDDMEFKNSLKGYVNTSYAKALLYKLEYKKVKNIEVDIRKVTVEHLMPQTLSDD